jgi:integrase
MTSAGPEKWASIRKRDRKNGTTCYAVLHWIDGRQVSLPFDNIQTAEAFVAVIKAHGAIRAREMHGIPMPKQRDPLTVAAYLQKHIKELTGVEQYTIDKYTEYLTHDITPALGDIPLAELRESDIAAWVQTMATTKTKRKRLPAAKTIANKHGFLSGALAVAVQRGLIPANPAAGRRLPRQATESADDMRMLSRDEFKRLVAATDERWRPLLEFLVVTGCRWSEASALKPGDVDQDAGVVRIRRAWKYSSQGYQIGPTKTKRSRRDINVPAEVLKKLDYSGEWLFTAVRGGAIRYGSFRPNVWDKAVAKAKLDPPPTPHDLRHTCASWMLTGGIPIAVVSRHLGHEDIQTTVNIYGDVDRSSFEAAAEVMGKMLG